MNPLNIELGVCSNYAPARVQVVAPEKGEVRLGKKDKSRMSEPYTKLDEEFRSNNRMFKRHEKNFNLVSRTIERLRLSEEDRLRNGRRASWRPRRPRITRRDFRENQQRMIGPRPQSQRRHCQTSGNGWTKQHRRGGAGEIAGALMQPL